MNGNELFYKKEDISEEDWEEFTEKEKKMTEFDYLRARVEVLERSLAHVQDILAQNNLKLEKVEDAFAKDEEPWEILEEEE